MKQRSVRIAPALASVLGCLPVLGIALAPPAWAGSGPCAITAAGSGRAAPLCDPGNEPPPPPPAQTAAAVQAATTAVFRQSVYLITSTIQTHVATMLLSAGHSDKRASAKGQSAAPDASPAGAGANGVGASGIGPNGAGANGAGASGIGPNGAGPNGAGPNGAGASAIGSNGAGPNRANPSGAESNGILDASNPTAPGADDHGAGAASAASATGSSSSVASSLWSDGSQGALDNTSSGKKYHGTHRIIAVGTDYRYDEHILAGIAVAPDTTTLDLQSVGGHRALTGGTVTLYSGYKFNDTYAASAIIGYGHASNFIRLPSSAGWTKDNFGSNRYFGQFSTSASYQLDDDWRLIPSVNYTQSSELAGSSKASLGATGSSNATHLGTARIGTQLEYSVSDSFVPFVNTAFEHDLINSQGGSNRTGMVVGSGFLAPVSDNLSLGVAVTSSFGRGGQSDRQYGANIRYSW